MRPYAGLVLSDVLTCAASGSPNRLAVTLGDEKLTFAQAASRANRASNALLGLGVSAGDRVAWWSDISLAGVDLYFGIGRVGAAFAPLNPAYTSAEARAVLEYLRPRLVLVDPAHAEEGEALTRDLGLEIATVGGAGPGVDFDQRTAAAQDGEPPVPLPSEDEINTIFLTSGSTGRPKGVMISHRATWLRTHAGAAAHVTIGGRGEVVMFPLFHMAGWNFATQAWSAHHAAHLVHRADADELLGNVDRWGAGTLYCIPAVWRRILSDGAGFDGRSLEWALTGTSQVTTELLLEMKGRFPNSQTTVNYGSTETARAVGLADRDLFTKPGSVGQPIPGVRAAIATDGELLLRTDRVMSGYFDLPHETAEVLRDGWYHTGDLAERDDDGYLSIVGRKKEVIRSGGETIAPVDVEAVVATFPGISDVAVIGIDDEQWGEVVCAVVVVDDGAPVPTVADLRAHIGDRLAPYKHPRRVISAPSLPRTSATGQVQRSAIRKQLGV
jgi:fatty-acyl-CoA synthase